MNLTRFLFLRLQGVADLGQPVYNGFLDKPDPPAPPDYVGAAAQQGQSNINSAIATGVLNRPDEVNPFGSRTFEQTGTFDVNGTPVPRFTATTQLSPEGQDLLNQSIGLQKGLIGLGQNSLSQVSSALAKPLDLGANRDALVQSMFNRSTRLLDPYYAKAEDALHTDLANRGFSVGDKGYENAQGEFQRNKDAIYANAMDAANTSGAQQAIQEALIQRQLPLQELNAIRTGGSPTPAQFQPYAGSGPVAAAPNFAATQAAGNFGQQNYAIESGAYNNQMSGLFGLGSAGILAAALA